jgi:serine/threonine-protein kinase RsbW
MTSSEMRTFLSDNVPCPGAGTAVFRLDRLLQRTDEIVPILAVVAAVLDGMGYLAADIHGVRLALEEAIVNGIRHGNQGDPTKSVRVRISAGAEGLFAEVEDAGPGFDPGHVPDPTLPENLERNCGRGLLLMRHFMTWLHFSSRGNRVAMCKCRSS